MSRVYLRAAVMVLVLLAGCSCGASPDDALPAEAEKAFAAYAAAWQQRDAAALAALQAPDRGLPAAAFYDELFAAATVRWQPDGGLARQAGADTWVRSGTWLLYDGERVAARLPATVVVARMADGQWRITSSPDLQ